MSYKSVGYLLVDKKNSVLAVDHYYKDKFTFDYLKYKNSFYLLFIYICIAVGDPAINRGGLGSH